MDSFYLWPLTVNGVLTPDPKRGGIAHYLTYDKKGRIIKDSSHYTDPYITGSSVNSYSYDAAGNRTDRPLYDDKINIHRTNKIWMFFDRDYSDNIPFIAESYNSIGLPTKVSSPSKIFQGMTFLHSFQVDRVTYKCK